MVNVLILQMRLFLSLWLLLASVEGFFISPKVTKALPRTTMFAAVAKRGIFSPAVEGAKKLMGEQELREFRAKVILEHSKVIGKFVDTSDSKFGRIALKALFEAADGNGDGTLDVDEVRAACNALGFSWLDEEKSQVLVAKADVDENDVIDFEEFCTSAPKVLRTNLVKLAKQNGNDLGFLI